MKFYSALLIATVSSVFFTQCTMRSEAGTIEHIHEVTSLVDDERLSKANETPEDWLSHGRNYSEDRFSRLNQITKENIEQLGLAWSFNMEVKRGIEATPLVVDGIMYVTGNYSIVYAIDARNGELIWKYDPKVAPTIGIKACCGTVNRGAALYKGLVYVGALDGRLIALDAATGQPKWEAQTIDTTANYTITGAPRVVDGKVIIGNGGAEFGVRGYVTAYDAMTGDKVWRFYTVPGDPSLPFESKAMEEAAKTWTGEWWKVGGGGTAWDAMAYDPELNLLYVGVGNGSPWPRLYRSPEGGDNLYLSSIVALNPQNGELVWYYQTTPGDNWDYTATQQLILANLNIDNKERKVIMQAPKNGFFYVLDRSNGEIISAEPYVYVNWARGIDKSTGRPIENEWSKYEIADAEIFPSHLGGHNWQPMAYNSKTGLVYIPTQEVSKIFGHDPDWEFAEGFGKTNAGVLWGAPNPNKPVRKDTLAPDPNPVGRLIAWDPVNQKEVWRVNYDEVWWNGGVLTTDGSLVFQGRADGHFSAFDTENGEKLWETDLGTGIMAAPMTYAIDGIQYISVAVGWGGPLGKSMQFSEYNFPGTVYTFALNGKTPLPDYPKPPLKTLANYDFESDEVVFSRGMALYDNHCSHCHTEIARETGGAYPDLGYMGKEIYDSFEAIVLKGIFSLNGMPSFDKQLTSNDISDIKNYIIATANSKIEEKTNGNTK